MKIWRYVKSAFLNRWNLLALAGGAGAAYLSGRAEVLLPLLTAAELAWLGFVGTHPTFQRFVDTTEHSESNEKNAAVAATRMRRMLAALPRGAQVRFQSLMNQCQELRNIAQQVQSASAELHDEPIASSIQLGGLDRLMWLFLKLLYAEFSLNRFFETTTIEQIQRELKDVTQRLERETQRPSSPQRDRIIATLTDSRRTCEDRLRNFEQARDSFELVKAEQQRLETRIRSLAEMGISRGDPATLSSQVDSAAGSIELTEKTLDELRFVTGFSMEDEAVPEILPRARETQ